MGGEATEAMAQRDLAEVARVIRKFKRPQLLKKQFMIIDPRTSRFYTRWSWLTSFALIFTAIMTPVEVGFMDIPADRWADGLFITNRCVDIIFIFDSILQCFMMCASRSCRTPWRHGRCCCHAAACRRRCCRPLPIQLFSRTIPRA